MVLLRTVRPKGAKAATERSEARATKTLILFSGGARNEKEESRLASVLELRPTKEMPQNLLVAPPAAKEFVFGRGRSIQGAWS